MDRFRPFGQFVHPAGMMILALAVALMADCWALALVVFGAELMTLREHQARYHQNGFFDHGLVWFLGLLGAVLGLGGVYVTTPQGTSVIWAVLLIATSQRVSATWHGLIHSSSRRWQARLEVAAYLLLTLGLALFVAKIGVFHGAEWLPNFVDE